jgi:hypothetical protein
MKKQLAIAALALSAFATPTVASAATCIASTNTCTFTPGDTEFRTSGDTTPPITGAVAASIGRNGMGAGTFTDIYAFIVDRSGIGSGSFSTSLSGPNSNINFLSATINGKAVNLLGQNSDVEFGGASNIAITAGILNTLQITYESAGLGSYGGNLTFTPSAVPEPATWAMMVGGFGLVGFGLRRRRGQVQFA